MFDFEIATCFENVPAFAGVYARDRIPEIKSYPYYIIVNTDKASQPGMHWVAFRCTRHECEYFDSFGIPPIYPEFCKLYHNKKLQWNGRCIQHPRSKTCGEFCISFVKERMMKKSFTKFINGFSRDTKSNDKLVRRICKKAIM